jgi:hypothetical protein
MGCGLIWSQKPQVEFCEKVTAGDTNETIYDIARKNSAVTQIISNAEQTSKAKRSEKVLKPSFRFYIIPLGAICTLASLSAQNASPRAQRDSGPTFVRQQVVDCSNKNPRELCVISFDSEASAR